MFKVISSPSSIKFSFSRAKKLLGYPADITLSPKTEKILADQLDRAYQLITPVTYLKKFPPDEIVPYFKESLPETAPLQKACPYWKESYLFVSTLGQNLENEVKKLLQENNYTQGLVLDAVGSVLTEGVLDFVQEEHLSSKEGCPWVRYSPGYCLWSIQGQKEIFRLLGNQLSEVALTEKCLLIPEKTISGIVAQEENSGLVRACFFCPKQKQCQTKRVVKQAKRNF